MYIYIYNCNCTISMYVYMHYMPQLASASGRRPPTPSGIPSVLAWPGGLEALEKPHFLIGKMMKPCTSNGNNI